MKEPYESIYRSVAAELRQLGFSVECDNEYEKTLRKGKFKLKFGAERYQSLVLLTTLDHDDDDEAVGPMHVLDIMRELAPDRAQVILKSDSRTRQGLRNSISEEIRFLRDYESQIFVRPAEYRRRYDEQHRPDWA